MAIGITVCLCISGTVHTWCKYKTGIVIFVTVKLYANYISLLTMYLSFSYVQILWVKIPCTLLLYFSALHIYIYIYIYYWYICMAFVSVTGVMGCPMLVLCYLLCYLLFLYSRLLVLLYGLYSSYLYYINTVALLFWLL